MKSVEIRVSVVKAKADKVKERMSVELARLANDRLCIWRDEFTSRWPRLSGQIIFGMGSEYVTVGGRTIYEDENHRSLAGLWAAIRDIHEITDSYILGCPDDLVW